MILGIDLGTSNSMAAVYREGKVEFIPGRTGSRVIPSVVSMDEEGLFYAGEVAKERKLKYPHMTVDLFKRSMGSKKTFTIGDKEIMAEELSAVVLRSLKENAESYLGEPVTEAIISVPAFFNNAQRRSVLQAGKLAGFEEKIILVLDLGGGTFDISVMEASDTVMEVVAVCGDNKLGGSDFTNRLISLFKEANQIKEIADLEEESALWEQAERAKKQISATGVGTIICSIHGKQYEYSITEAEYEEACFDLLERIRKLTVRAVEESKYKSREIEDVIMVGGGTKLSIVKRAIEKLAGKKLDYPISPDEAVAMGAAIQGAMFEKKEDMKELIMTDIAPYYIGTVTLGGDSGDLHTIYDVVVPKNVTIPYKGTIVHNMGSANFSMCVYQMEDKYGEHVSEIGKLNYQVPNLGDGRHIPVHKSVYYDNNGIIHLSVYIPATGVTFEGAVSNENDELSEQEARKRLEELKYLNMSDREQDADSLLLARADAIYMELDIKSREYLGGVIAEFESAVKKGKRSDIMKARQNLSRLLDSYRTQDF